MNPDYTHLSLVVDRSGSMHSIRSDAQGGIDLLLDEQFALPGKLTLSLAQFDSEFEVVARMTEMRPDYALAPRGSTALLDAVGKTITITGEDLAALPEDERPVHVLFCVVTDGFENASTEWKIDDLKAKIAEQKDVYGWHFLFIGADDSKWQGEQLGMAAAGYSSTTQGSSIQAYAAASTATTNMRTGMSSTYTSEDVE